MPESMAHMEARIRDWALADDRIRAVVVVGSQARPGTTTRWSDLDVTCYVTDPAPFLADNNWMAPLGEVWVCLPLENPGWIPTRLTWFRGAEKVDFSFGTVAYLQQQVREQTLDPAAAHGYRVLVDKDGLAAQLPPLPPPEPPRPTPDEFEYDVTVFWYEALHVGQFIRARELWVAKYRQNTLNDKLLHVMGWHAAVVRGWDGPIKPIGKGLAVWGGPELWRAAGRVWAGFDPASAWRALLESADLFHTLAGEAAAALGYPYPVETGEEVRAYLHALYAEDDLRDG